MAIKKSTLKEDTVRGREPKKPYGIGTGAKPAKVDQKNVKKWSPDQKKNKSCG